VNRHIVIPRIYYNAAPTADHNDAVNDIIKLSVDVFGRMISTRKTHFDA